MDRIRIDGLRELGVHGVLPEEQTRPQPFEIDVELHVDLTAASESDQLDDTVDYRQSTKLLSELADHNVPHEKLFFETEFHGFSERKNYEKFLTALEKFLAKNL